MDKSVVLPRAVKVQAQRANKLHAANYKKHLAPGVRTKGKIVMRPGPTQVSNLELRQVQAKAGRRIDKVLRNPKGLPNGKGERKKLSRSERRAFKSALLHAVGHGFVLASHGPLPNRLPGRGNPPDNAIFVFIDDIMRAFEAPKLKPGLRYAPGSESLPVRLYQELVPLLWPYSAHAPRRVFERWQRYATTLSRG